MTCICSGPGATASTYQVKAVPFEKVTRAIFWRAPPRLQRILIALIEPVQWLGAFAQIRRMDMLIVPGTGLLTDAWGLLTNWGPRTLFRWSLLAKICRCKLLLVSVGAGPLYTHRGRRLTKSILRLADFRSYRDQSTRDYLTSIGFPADGDQVFPDLAYSLPREILLPRNVRDDSRYVVGLGVMQYPGKYSVRDPTDRTYPAYLASLSTFTEWLLERGYQVRLLSGDRADNHTRQELQDLLRKRSTSSDAEQIIDEPLHSVDDLLSQIAATDIVVATRFHNVLLALLSNKPVIAISFHHKCRSLMNAMGMDKYCLDMNDFSADVLIAMFVDLQKNAAEVIAQIGERTAQYRAALDQQYQTIFGDMWPA